MSQPEVPVETAPTKPTRWWEWVQRFGPIFTLLSALAAWGSACAASRSSEAARKSAAISEESSTASRDAARASFYMLLKQRYYTVDQGLPDQYRSNKFRPLRKKIGTTEDDPQWRAIRSYWYHCFDEWYSTTQVSPGLVGHMWEDYYLPAHLSALDKRALRGVFIDMCNKPDGEFRSGKRIEFVNELKKRFHAAHGRDLEELPAPPPDK